MRIGIDARMYSSAFTGIGRYVYELTERLFDPQNNDHEWVIFMNEPQYSAFTPPHDRVKKVLVNARHYSFAEQIRFCWLLYKERLDVMHFTHFNAPILYRKPCVVTIHDLTLSFFPGKKMQSPVYRLAYHWAIRSIVNRAKRIIAVSKNTKADLMAQLRVPEKKIEVIYQATAPEFRPVNDEKFIKKTVQKYGIDSEFMLYTGVWRSHKNLVRLIQAFGRLCEDSDFKGQLVMTGRDDPFYPEVKETIRELGLRDRVVLTGLVDEAELIALYTAAQLYVFPSLYEGFGMPPLEAMACGTPVVASKSSCIPEICGTENARFFDPNDVKNMTNVIRNIWNNSQKQAHLIRNGFERVTQFSWDEMAKATLLLYAWDSRSQ